MNLGGRGVIAGERIGIDFSISGITAGGNFRCCATAQVGGKFWEMSKKNEEGDRWAVFLVGGVCL